MTYPWNQPSIWHAFNVHLPIVLAVLGVPMVCWVAITRGRSGKLRWGAVLLYAGAAAAAYFAAITGEAAKADLPFPLAPAARERIEFHARLAEFVWMLAGATALMLLLANLPRRWARQTFLTIGLVISVLTAVWVGITAHSGGVAVYEFGLGTIALKSSPSPTTQRGMVSPMASQSVSYTRDVKPILESRCANCHSGEDRKSDYDVTSIPNLLMPGKKNGPGIVAGKSDQSALVAYIEGKRDPRMPKGKPPLADAEIGQIRKWIDDGAKDDTGTVLASASLQHRQDARVTGTPTTQSVDPEFDPNLPWQSSESIAVRRFVRLKFLPNPPAIPKVAVPTTNPIDNFIAAKWPIAAGATQPAVPDVCDDPTFVRRVYLNIVGYIPAAAEAREFVEDKSPDKRAKLIDTLLAKSEDYAANWVPFWEDALCSNGLHQGGVGTHGNYRAWIKDGFEKNKPYDVMAAELLDPTLPAHPGRYILNDNHMRTVQSASDTAQVFLGTAIKCASCHNHFLNDEWPQARAVGFAGFFASKDLEVIRCERGTGNFVNTHFMFDLPKAPTSAPADQNLRLRRVAQLITDPTNPRFAKTIVNRLWKRYVGLGFFEPADDYRLDVTPSHPELLDWLADDFMRHGYDLKHTIKLILNSRTYQLRYDPALADKFDVEKPAAPRYFRSPGLRRLTSEQLFDSINVAVTQRTLSQEDRAYADDKSTPLSRALGKPSARNEVQTARPDDTAVVQSLELLNGQEYHDRVYKGSLISQLAVTQDRAKVVENLYWSALNRAPAEKEKQVTDAFLKSATTKPTTKPIEIVLVDDALPAGAKTAGKWVWGRRPAHPVLAGKRSHADGETEPVPTQHLFTGIKLTVAPSDVLFVYTFLDPENLPREVMIQFLAGAKWHRAYWGDNAIPMTPVTKLGDLPKPGSWIRLEVTGKQLGFDKPTEVTGISFDQFAGRVYWDKLGITKGPAVNDPEVVGDMLWALLTSPEFQYIR